MRAVIIALLLSLLPSTSPSQVSESGRVRGTVTDSSNGQPLPYANVHLQGTTLGAATNAEGFYHISAVPPGSYVLVISHLGFRMKVVPIRVAEGIITEANIQLVPVDIKGPEVVVTGERPKRLEDAPLTMQRITARDVSMVPAGAEPDVFRTVQASPGVGTTSDVSARYYVRGGAGDQNLVLLNGATVYNPFHTLGIFSALDPEAVSLLEFHKGGYPPSYGGRLSSILNIVTREGNKNRLQGTGSASFLSGKAAIEGPIPDGSFLVTGRKSWYAQFVQQYLNNQSAPFDFYDLTWKITYASPSIDKNSRFIAHGFVSGDQVLHRNPHEEDYVIRNRIVGMSWKKIWSSPLYSTISLSYSGFDAEVHPNQSSAKPRTNRVSDISADWDFSYLYDSKDELAFGLQTKLVQTSLQLENQYGSRVHSDQRGVDLSSYADYRFYRWENINLALGMRFKWMAISEYRPILFEPRLSMTIKAAPWVSVRAAAGMYSQEMLTVVDESELVSIFEPWIITPDYLYSASAFHASVGTQIQWMNLLSTEVEVYYKPIRNLAVENPEKYLPRDRDFMNASGEAYGVEALTQFRTTEIVARVSYALSWVSTTRNGVKVLPRYDVRHSLGVLVGWELGDGWHASATWTVRSGMPLTPVVGYYDRVEFDPWQPPYDLGAQKPTPLWGAINSIRFPVYHRMDVGANKEIHWGDFTIAIGASIINLYDQRNIFYLDRTSGEPVYMLRFLPSIFLKVQR